MVQELGLLEASDGALDIASFSQVFALGHERLRRPPAGIELRLDQQGRVEIAGLAENFQRRFVLTDLSQGAPPGP